MQQRGHIITMLLLLLRECMMDAQMYLSAAAQSKRATVVGYTTFEWCSSSGILKVCYDIF
jgi:hypothetical protein